jgi:hypothetical protein
LQSVKPGSKRAQVPLRLDTQLTVDPDIPLIPEPQLRVPALPLIPEHQHIPNQQQLLKQQQPPKQQQLLKQQQPPEQQQLPEQPLPPKQLPLPKQLLLPRPLLLLVVPPLPELFELLWSLSILRSQSESSLGTLSARMSRLIPWEPSGTPIAKTIDSPPIELVVPLMTGPSLSWPSVEQRRIIAAPTLAFQSMSITKWLNKTGF